MGQQAECQPTLPCLQVFLTLAESHLSWQGLGQTARGVCPQVPSMSVPAGLLVAGGHSDSLSCSPGTTLGEGRLAPKRLGPVGSTEPGSETRPSPHLSRASGPRPAGALRSVPSWWREA